MPTTLTGGCHCRNTTYTITIPDEPYDILPGFPAPFCDFDHCPTCRKVTGSVMVSWMIVPTAWLKVDSKTKKTATGSEESTLSEYRSSEDILRSFCGSCGTPLFYYVETRKGSARDIIDVTLGSLDEESYKGKEDLVKPKTHAWWGEGIGWFKDMIREGHSGGKEGEGIGALRKCPTGNPTVTVDE